MKYNNFCFLTHGKSPIFQCLIEYMKKSRKNSNFFVDKQYKVIYNNFNTDYIKIKVKYEQNYIISARKKSQLLHNEYRKEDLQ